jgi:hypothetical protein
MSIRYYAQAIDILMGTPVDFKAMCIELAKQNPELFCHLAAQAAPSKDNAWHKEALRFMREGNKIGAIKLCREKTGFGLREAKDIIDAIGTRDTDHWFSPVHLYDEQMAVYKDMVRSL